MTEIWKDIKDYEGLYQVSNLGRIKSSPRVRIGNGTPYTTKERILKSSVGATGGYYRVNLCNKDSKRKMYYVHRLVANAFIPRINGKNVVNHINGDKTNNNVTNLEWTTTEENLKHAIDHHLNFRNEYTGRYERKVVV